MAVSLRDRDADSGSFLTGSTVTDDLRLFTTAERQSLYRQYFDPAVVQKLAAEASYINIATKLRLCLIL